jgi:hypothetical protein
VTVATRIVSGCAAAAGEHDAQGRVTFAELGEQRVDLALDRLEIDGQLNRLRGALEAVEVRAKRERPPGVEPDHLEHPVAAQKPVVGDGNPRVGGRSDRSVNAGQLHHSHRCIFTHPAAAGFSTTVATPWPTPTHSVARP